jgi:hypothetical protein
MVDFPSVALRFTPAVSHEKDAWPAWFRFSRHSMSIPISGPNRALTGERMRHVAML